MLRRRVIGLLALAGSVTAGGAVAAATVVRAAPAGGETAAAAAPSPARADLAATTARPRQQPPPRAKTAAQRRLEERRRVQSRIVWRQSRAIGTHGSGRLVDGVRLSREGVHFFTWDPVRWRSPSPGERRYGTDRLLRTVLRVAKQHRAANPRAPRLAIGDISRPRGGSFDARYGGLAEFGRGRGTLGHVSHQNGLDVDVYYPRRDRKERAPDRLADIDRKLAQDLVDRFVAAGAQFVFVGPRTGLTGPPGVVQPLARHDDHLHVRLPLRP